MNEPSQGDVRRHPAGLLREMGRHADRRLSQSFLCEPAIAEAMVRAADLSPSDTVLEIGPGLGILTRPLVQSGAQVICIELDDALVEQLARSLSSPPNLRVIHDDALRVDLAQIVEEPFIVVASLPYHVGTPLLFRLLFERPRPIRVVAMIQQEVAERLAPRAGISTFLGTVFGLVAEVRIVRRVSAGAFFPVPKVQSAIIRLDVRSAPLAGVGDVSHVTEFVRAGFTQPRQQLHNSLARGLAIPPDEARRRIQDAGIDPTRRAGSLAISEWIQLAAAFEPS